MEYQRYKCCVDGQFDFELNTHSAEAAAREAAEEYYIKGGEHFDSVDVDVTDEAGATQTLTVHVEFGPPEFRVGAPQGTKA